MTPNFKLFLLALALLLGVATCVAAAEGDAYKSLEDAAYTALDDAERLTNKYEAGGTLYQCGHVFAYLAPVTSKLRTSVDIPIWETVGCTLAGIYHTHPTGAAAFSKTDIRHVCKLRTVGFIRPRDGDMISFDCRGLSPREIDAAIEKGA